jgi:hypothetical protein
MNSAISRRAQVIRRLANGVRQAVGECNEATRVLTTLTRTPGRVQADPDRAPDTYAEFLIRTAGVSRREPERTAGRG